MEAKKLTCTIASSQIVCSIEPSGKAPLETGELTNHRCTSQINSKTALPPVEPVGKSQQFHWLHLHCKMTTLWFCSLLRRPSTPTAQHAQTAGVAGLRSSHDNY